MSQIVRSEIGRYGDGSGEFIWMRNGDCWFHSFLGFAPKRVPWRDNEPAPAPKDPEEK